MDIYTYKQKYIYLMICLNHLQELIGWKLSCPCIVQALTKAIV